MRTPPSSSTPHSYWRPVLVTLLLAVLLSSAVGAGRAPVATSVDMSSNGATAPASVAVPPSTTWQSYPVPAQFPTAIGPGVATDPVDHSLVVFGGCLQVACTSFSNETWTEANGTWMELRPALSPPGRGEAQMAWDPADGYVLLFGGIGCQDPPTCTQTGPLNDTWAFKAGTWNPVISSGPSPPPTDQGGLAYDPSDRLMVQFGGSACSSECVTWTYAGGTWTELNLSLQPPARYGNGLAEDDADGGALLFGGITFGEVGVALNDTWLFSGGAWHPENDTAAPPARWSLAMTWDPALEAVVMYGGRLAGSVVSTFDSAYAFEAGLWSPLTVTTTPALTWMAGFAPDPTTGTVVLVGAWSCPSSGCPVEEIEGLGPVHAVTLISAAGTCANFTFGGYRIPSGSAAEVQNGTYPLEVAACPDYLISNLTASALLAPNATTQNVSVWNGTVQVHGDGTLEVNMTRVASNPHPTGLAAISVLGLSFLELLLIGVALVAVVGVYVAVARTSRRRPPPTDEAESDAGSVPPSASSKPPPKS
jgi:hypothetical protein